MPARELQEPGRRRTPHVEHTAAMKMYKYSGVNDKRCFPGTVQRAVGYLSLSSSWDGARS